MAGRLRGAGGGAAGGSAGPVQGGPSHSHAFRRRKLQRGSRREIFERLARRPRAVGELAAGLPISRPAVSQHLRVLKDAGLVSDRRVGTRRIYQVDPAGVAALRAQLDRFWSQALASYKEVVEQPTDGELP